MRGALRGPVWLLLLCLVGAARADPPLVPAPNLGTAFPARVRAAALLAAQGRWGPAADEYGQALALEPDFTALQAEADTLLVRSDVLQGQVFAAQERHDDQAADAAIAAQGDADRQLRAGRDILALRDAFAEAHANDALVLDRLGRVAEALTQFDAAVELRPAFADRLVPLRAAAYLHLGEDRAGRGLPDAVPEYREAVRLAPTLAPAHRGLGQALLASGQAEEAVGELREAVRLAPADSPTASSARLLLGTALVQTGQRDAARALWQLLAGDRDAAVRDGARRLLDQYPADSPAPPAAPSSLGPSEDPDIRQGRDRVRSQPEDAMAHNDLGLALHRAGRDAEALAELQAAVRLDRYSDLAHTNLGLVLESSGQPDAAVREYEAALKVNPDDWVAHNNLGALLSDQGRWPEAEGEARKALLTARNNAGAHLNLGSALVAEGKLSEAAREFARASQLSPDLAAAHAGLGFVWDRLGRSGDAVAEYRRAVALVPDRAQAFLDMAGALCALPDHAGEVTSYRAVMRLFPDHAAAHAGLAELLLAVGDAEGAGAEYQAALWRQPDFAAAYAGLGRVRLGQGRYDPAIRALRRAVALDASDAGARNTLGLALYESGDKAGAWQQWREAAASDDAGAAHNAAGLMQEFPEKLRGTE